MLSMIGRTGFSLGSARYLASLTLRTIAPSHLQKSFSNVSAECSCSRRAI
jgi:hypothetical protein